MQRSGEVYGLGGQGYWGFVRSPKVVWLWGDHFLDKKHVKESFPSILMQGRGLWPLGDMSPILHYLVKWGFELTWERCKMETVSVVLVLSDEKLCLITVRDELVHDFFHQAEITISTCIEEAFIIERVRWLFSTRELLTFDVSSLERGMARWRLISSAFKSFVAREQFSNSWWFRGLTARSQIEGFGKRRISEPSFCTHTGWCVSRSCKFRPSKSWTRSRRASGYGAVRLAINIVKVTSWDYWLCQVIFLTSLCCLLLSDLGLQSRDLLFVQKVLCREGGLTFYWITRGCCLA